MDQKRGTTYRYSSLDLIKRGRIKRTSRRKIRKVKYGGFREDSLRSL